MAEQKIEILEHTADLAVRLTAEDQMQLFKLGAKAVYQLITENICLEGEPKKFPISLQANNIEELLHDWLAEVLYWFQVRQIIFDDINIEILTPTHLKIRAQGKKLNVEKSSFHTEIKAVTYHNLQVEKNQQGWTATVIFDV